jgi:hypothetical protein
MREVAGSDEEDSPSIEGIDLGVLRLFRRSGRRGCGSLCHPAYSPARSS